MSRPWMDKERQMFYNDAIREVAHQHIAMAQIDAGRDPRLTGCMIGLFGSDLAQAFRFKQTCVTVIRHCETEITGNLLPLYTTAGRLYKRFLKAGNNAKIDKLKRQMQRFAHTLALFQSLQESAYVVIDTYYDQYDALVMRGLAPILSEEEKLRRDRHLTRVPIIEERAVKLKKKKHATKDRAEREGLRVHKARGKDALEKAFLASLQDDIVLTAAEKETIFDEASKAEKKLKTKKKSRKKTGEKSKKKKAEREE